jgi:Coenzyme PQQ synthesis protein D (PqqD)
MRRKKPAVFSQRPGLDTRIVDADAFVITRTTIKHLNAAGAVVWLLLEEPSTRRELLSLLREIYPAVAWQKLSADLGKLLANLQNDGLLAGPAHALPISMPVRKTRKPPTAI